MKLLEKLVIIFAGILVGSIIYKMDFGNHQTFIDFSTYQNQKNMEKPLVEDALGPFKETEGYTCNFNSNTNIPGPEDIQKLNENIAILSSSHQLQMSTPPNGIYNLKTKIKGKLALYFFESQEVKIVDIKNFPLKKSIEFQPHGIYFDEKNQKLFVSNHQHNGKGDAIEEFQVNFINKNTDVEILYNSSYNLPPEFCGLFNDLIKVDYGVILATAWLSGPLPCNGNLDRVKQVHQENMESYRLDKKQSYVYKCTFDEGCGQVNKDIQCSVVPGTQSNSSNGINWDRINKVVVANTLERRAQIFKLNKGYMGQNSNKDEHYLEKMREVELFGHPDNVDYDIHTKKFYIAGFSKHSDHAQFNSLNLIDQYEYLEKSREERNQDYWLFVDELIPKSLNYEFQVNQGIFQNRMAIGGPTVAINYKNQNQWVIGSWFDKSVVTCVKN